MDIRKVEKAILKYNPLNLTQEDLIIYEELYSKIIQLKHITADNIQNIFIDRFGDNRVLFEMRKNNNVYHKICDEIKSE